MVNAKVWQFFRFTSSTDVLLKSKFEFQAKITCNFRSQKTILRLFGKKKMAKVRYQIIPLIFSFIFGGVFCDTLEQLRCPKYHRNATKKRKMRGILLIQQVFMLDRCISREFAILYTISIKLGKLNR